jgi:hypothetical protein
MKKMNVFVAALVVAATASFVPQAHAASPVVRVMAAGSSALWQSMALGAYNDSKCPTGGKAPCFHYTAKNFNLTDTRPATLGGTNPTDQGNIWIVWDSSTAIQVWAFIKVDSGVGNRCYFAQPRCNVSLSPFPAPANLISSTLWGDSSEDTTPPSSVSGLFTSGTLLVNTAATDIRPEDALFATCRSNSVLGGGTDGLAGLGYGENASGVCPSFGASLADLQGGDIKSGSPGSTATAHLLAFNISGKDPFTDTAIPTASTESVGATPVIPITSRSGALKSVTNASDTQMQNAFSGANCLGNNFTSGTSGDIQVFLREPISGTMNTTEYSVLRRPNLDGVSQETNVDATNPLAGKACTKGGGRYRGIGTGEVVGLVQNSNADFSTDGIAYTFFSYGNVSSIANSSSYGYLTLNGTDGIFAKYAGGDPGQPSTNGAAAGTLPAAANLPATCSGAFPCPETDIWTGGLSFPNVRSGTYRAWSDLRMVSNGTALSYVKTLIATSQAFAVNSTPDFIPFAKTGADPGLKIVRSHYGASAVNSGTKEAGRDAGGCIETGAGNTTIDKVQEAPGKACATFIEPNG